jgi:hypothetical protein
MMKKKKIPFLGYFIVDGGGKTSGLGYLSAVASYVSSREEDDDDDSSLTQRPVKRVPFDVRPDI